MISLFARKKTHTICALCTVVSFLFFFWIWRHNIIRLRRTIIFTWDKHQTTSIELHHPTDCEIHFVNRPKKMILCFEYDVFSKRIAFYFLSVMCSIVLLWLDVVFFAFLFRLIRRQIGLRALLMPVCKSEPSAFHFFHSLVWVCVCSFCTFYLSWRGLHVDTSFIRICNYLYNDTVHFCCDYCFGCLQNCWMHVDSSREAQKENSVWTKSKGRLMA